MITFSRWLAEKTLEPAGNLDIAREDMPQITSDCVPDFLQFLQDHGVDHRRTKLVAGHLKPMQNEIRTEKVKAVKNKPAKPIIVSRDMRILDGHHRWAAQVSEDRHGKIDCYLIDADMSKLLQLARDFPQVIFKK